jgi:hypothetical protein
MKEAVVSYEDKPREVWIFEPPAQVALCSVQIWWTVEVNIAFQRLEEGFENALKEFNKKQVCFLFITLLWWFYSTAAAADKAGQVTLSAFDELFCSLCLQCSLRDTWSKLARLISYEISLRLGSVSCLDQCSRYFLLNQVT